jgi:hypothetical protein
MVGWLGDDAQAILAAEAAGKTTRGTTDSMADVANGVRL